MRLALIILVMLGIPFAAGGIIALREHRSRTRTGAIDPRAKQIRDNHAQMARLLDHILGDEMIFIDEPRRDKGRDLLARYYEEGATK